MKTVPNSHSTLRRAAVITLLIVALIGLLSTSRVAPSGGASGPPADAPLIGLLTPHDGQAFNATNLHVEALVAALKSDPKSSLVFNGQTISGKNDGHIDHFLL